MLTETKEIKLSDGRVATVLPFKGKVVLETIRESAGQSEDAFLSILIAKTTKINGEAIVKEDIEEMNGFDCLKLVQEFSGNFTTPPATS